MSRFVMSIEQAVSLVIKSAEVAKGGEAFVTKMPAVMIEDLAKALLLEVAPIYGHDLAPLKFVKSALNQGRNYSKNLSIRRK